MGRLSKKRVVITGAAQGLGQALAMRMVDEGAKVVIGDMNLEGAKKTAKEIGGCSLVDCIQKG
jgi:NAD(P)-dependent dehydrogenase (short-subunit alcohol dehydrogenase family)